MNVPTYAPPYDLTREEILDNPWKYGTYCLITVTGKPMWIRILIATSAGYPQFSRWVASDKAWLITRRFSTLNARVILLLQDNIVELEGQLNKLDEAYSRPKEVMQDADNTHNGSFRLDRESRRTVILDNLTIALSKYSKWRQWHYEMRGAYLTFMNRFLCERILATCLAPISKKRRRKASTNLVS